MKKERLKIFISMPFTGKRFDDLVQERKNLSKLVDSYGFELVEQFIGYQFEEDFRSKSLDPSFIIGKDKNWMKEADVVVADLSSDSIGAYQEIVLAKELFEKKVYAIVPKEKRAHYWLRFYTDFFFDSVDDALKQVRRDFKNKHKHEPISKDQYDPIAIEYKRVENTPVQKCVYDYELREFLEREAKHKKIVVLHCGSGYRTRIASEFSKQVIGVDLSSRQISLAKAEEEKSSDNVRYYELDPYFSDFKKQIGTCELGSADIVIGFFLLDHARNKGELNIVVENCKSLLKKGGLFLGMIDRLTQVSSKSKYGVVLSREKNSKLEEGQPRRVAIHENGKEVLHFHNYIWSEKTVQKIFEEVGFAQVTLREARVSEELKKEYSKEFWDDYEKNPNQVIVRAQK